jgi:hypothetical protein
MVFNATFNNISAITWWSVKLDCELTGGYLIILDSPEKLSTVNNILKTYGMSIKQILTDNLL